jgi:hypothetical protein
MDAMDSRRNNLTTKGRLLRDEGIIPLAVKSILDGTKSLPFFISDLNTSWIGTAIFDSYDLNEVDPLLGGPELTKICKARQNLSETR